MKRLLVISIVAAMALVVVPAPASAKSRLVFFHTVDNSIGCGIVKGTKKKKKFSVQHGEARCDVRGHTWVAPPKPRYCDLDWGDGVVVGDKGFAGYVCAGDTVADASVSFAAGPGGTVALGRYGCAILPTNAVRCTNYVSGHGFEVSVAQVTLF